jgi:hypothetical protein
MARVCNLMTKVSTCRSWKDSKVSMWRGEVDATLSRDMSDQGTTHVRKEEFVGLSFSDDAEKTQGCSDSDFCSQMQELTFVRCLD